MSSRRSNGKRLTKQLCADFPAPEKGNKLYRCADTKGLALRVTEAGYRSFVFCYSAPTGHERRMTIGEFGTWSVQAARKQAIDLRRLVDRGVDPLEQRHEHRKAQTMNELFSWYCENDLSKLSDASQRDIRSCFRRCILPALGKDKLVVSLTRSDVQKAIDLITVRSGPTTANRSHSYLRRILNLAKADGLVAENVASSNIRRNIETPRDRYLSEAEIKRLFAAIDQSDAGLPALAIKLLALTGARKTEVLSMRWRDVDLEQKRWTKPPSNTKQRRVHHVPLSEPVIDILTEIQALELDNQFTFPGTGKSGHLTDVKKTWANLKSAAKIENCRLHDLRHTYASVIASGGGSLLMIGALLGHSQAQTTMRYAHLLDKSLREVTQLVAEMAKYE